MGNGMNKVLPGLFIGNFRDAKDMEQIEGNNITHIIAIHDQAKPSLENVTYKCIDISDSPGQNIGGHFYDCIEFIHKARVGGGNVLVHCIAGVSRSCTICAAYLITVCGLSWQQAIEGVRAARKCVNPNYGFQKQLQTFDLLEVEKVRTKMTILFQMEFDPADGEYIKKAFENCTKNETADEAQALGTTPTFASYARKKVNKK